MIIIWKLNLCEFKSQIKWQISLYQCIYGNDVFCVVYITFGTIPSSTSLLNFGVNGLRERRNIFSYIGIEYFDG